MVNPAAAGEEPDFFVRRLETVRFQENGWQEPCESRGSCTDLRGTGGEIPPVYPTHQFALFCDYIIVSQVEVYLTVVGLCTVFGRNFLSLHGSFYWSDFYNFININSDT